MRQTLILRVHLLTLPKEGNRREDLAGGNLSLTLTLLSLGNRLIYRMNSADQSC
jgi:hypothetical protein